MEENLILKLCQAKYFLRDGDKLYSVVTNLPIRITGDHLVFELGNKVCTTRIGESWETDEDDVHYFVIFHTFDEN